MVSYLEVILKIPYSIEICFIFVLEFFFLRLLLQKKKKKIEHLLEATVH